MVRLPRLQPNEVAFDIPQNLSKLDIRSYLENLYKVDILNVRTMNVQGKRTQNREDKSYYREPSFKRAFVTLKEPFEYPKAPDLQDFGKKTLDEINRLNKLKIRNLRIRPRPQNIPNDKASPAVQTSNANDKSKIVDELLLVRDPDQ